MTGNVSSMSCFNVFSCYYLKYETVMPDLEAQVLSFTIGDLEKNKVKFKAIVMD